MLRRERRRAPATCVKGISPEPPIASSESPAANAAVPWEERLRWFEELSRASGS
jgi:hypothetical protein